MWQNFSSLPLASACAAPPASGRQLSAGPAAIPGRGPRTPEDEAAAREEEETAREEEAAREDEEAARLREEVRPRACSYYLRMRVL